jgi:hypothetical protein
MCCGWQEVQLQHASTASRLTNEISQLHALQRDAARITVDEATKSHSDMVNLDGRVGSLSSRLGELDATTTFLKDTLYSVSGTTTAHRARAHTRSPIAASASKERMDRRF